MTSIHNASMSRSQSERSAPVELTQDDYVGREGTHSAVYYGSVSPPMESSPGSDSGLTTGRKTSLVGGDSNTLLSDELDAVIRRGFARKVFTILSIQLTVTAIIVTGMQLLANSWQTKYGRTQHAPGFAAVQICALVSTILAFVTLIVMSCNPHLCKQYPKNYGLLSLFTVLEGFAIGAICMQYTSASVWMGLATTAVVSGSLMAYAKYTKADFTGMGAYLFAAMMALIGFSFIAMIASFFMPVHGFVWVLNLCGALLFSMYIVYDTQLILGGKNRKYEIGIDDYVFASITLYLDIINLFLYLMELFGDRR